MKKVFIIALILQFQSFRAASQINELRNKIQCITQGKKYRSLKNELADLFDSLKVNPIEGDDLGKSCYKVRLGIESKGKGKRGRARVITYVVTDNEEVILLTIYDKKKGIVYCLMS